MIDQLEKLLSAMQQLKQAVDSHDQWYKNVTRVMICNQQPDLHDLADDAHRACHFGQWYFGDIPEVLSTHDAFIAMRPAHKRMHGIAAELLNLVSSGRVAPPKSFDGFVNALERFRLQLYTLLREVEEMI